MNSTVDPLDLPDEREYRYSLWIDTPDGAFIYWESDEYDDVEAIAECLYGWHGFQMYIHDAFQDLKEDY
jgi:hypothetical protein